MLAEMVDSYLCSHPAIEANPAWKAQADLAAQTLADLYQAIGAAHHSGEGAGEDTQPPQLPREVRPGRGDETEGRLKKHASEATATQPPSFSATIGVALDSMAERAEENGVSEESTPASKRD